MTPNKLPEALQKCNIRLNTEYLRQGNDQKGTYAFELIWKGEVVFKGGAFCPSPLDILPDGWRETLPRKALITLLDFLTVRKGDVEEEYFKDYTEKMWEFVNSEDADTIRLWIYDQENKKEE